MKKIIFTLLTLSFIACCIGCESSNDVEEPEKVVFKVSYENSKGAAPSDIEVENGTVLTVKELPEITSEGFDFKGWFDGETKAVPGEYTVTKNVKLAAKWVDASNPKDPEDPKDPETPEKVMFKVSYENSKGDAPSNIKVEKGTVLTIKELPEITFDGFDFKGWFDGETKAVPGEYTVTKDVKLAAKWIESEDKNVPELSFLLLVGQPSSKATLSWTNPNDENLAKIVVAASCESVSKYENEEFTDSASFTIDSGLTAGQTFDYTFPVKMYANYTVKVSAYSSDGKKIAEKTIKFTTKMATPNTDLGCSIVAIPLTSVFYIGKEDINTTFGYDNTPLNGNGDISWNRLFNGDWTNVPNSDTWVGPIYVPRNSDWFYMMHCSDAAGKNYYSNIMEINTDETITEKIGYIAYSDGTISKNYNSAKTPVGIVCQVDKNGKATRIVHLKQEAGVKWCASTSEGHALKSPEGKVSSITSLEDGSNNWEIIKSAVSDWETEGNYPYFEYIDSLDSSSLPEGCKWYGPARDELVQMLANKNAINKAIENLKNNRYSECTAISDLNFGSSSLYGYNTTGISIWGSLAGSAGITFQATGVIKKLGYNCRAISKWTEK